MNFKFILVLQVLILLFCLPLSGQQRFNEDSDGEFWYGGGAIATQSSMNGIYEMLVDESIFLPTPHDERIVNTVGGTFWARHGAAYSNFFIEGQFSFLTVLNPVKQLENFEGGHFYLKNDMGLEYAILFDYDQVSFGISPGWFIPLPNVDASTLGLYIIAGFNWTIISGTSIDYVSNEPQFDLAIEESLEAGLKYRNDLTFLPGIGLQAKANDKLAFELRYNQGWGLQDIIETQANPFFWREKTNNTRIHHQLALTAVVQFDN